MKVRGNKRKCNSDSSTSGRMFYDEWTSKFGVIKHGGKALSCSCN